MFPQQRGWQGSIKGSAHAYERNFLALSCIARLHNLNLLLAQRMRKGADAEHTHKHNEERARC